MSENVLLLCLSKVSFYRGLTTYVYHDPDNSVPEKREIEVTGYMTNEPSAKVALNLVELDRIVVICSEDVRKQEIPKLDTRKEEDEIREYIINDREFPISKEQYEKQIALKYTHYDYYQTVISNYAIDHNRTTPEFCIVEISNDPKEYEIAKAAVDAAGAVMGAGVQADTEDKLNDKGAKKDVHLYIDFNGGPRYIASMLLSTANLIEQRGAVIDNIFTMNIDNKDNKGRVVVERYMGVLQSLRLVSGIKEYTDYGRCNELSNYFRNHDDGIDQILNKMKALANDFQLCDAYRIFDKKKIKDLKDALEKYRSVTKNDPFEILFEYVTNDILECYKPLFNGVLEDNLLDVIDWCLDNDYIQQAVTFYTERMPIYFWDKHIYYPSEEEGREYKQIVDACNSIQDFEDILDQRQSIENPGSAPLDDNEKIEMEKQEYIDHHEVPSGTTRNNFEWNIKKNIKSLHTYFLHRDPKAVWMTQYLGNSKQYPWIDGTLKNSPFDYIMVDDLKQEDHCRIRSVIEDDNELATILKEYKDVKDQRNYINHADANGENSKRWSFDELIENLRKYVSHIRSIMNNTKVHEVS